MEYVLRKADKSDVDFLVGLRKLTMKKYLEEAGLPVTREAFLSSVLDEFDSAQIVMVGDRSAGLFKAKYDENIDEWYVVQIQVHPDYQNNKIASRLLTALIDKAKQTHSGVGLDVLKTNPAQRLYSRLGFVPVGEDTVQYDMKYKPGE